MPAGIPLPTSGGNILVDWTWGDEHVEVEVFPDGNLDVLVPAAGLDREGQLRLEDERWLTSGSG